ncbi:MAG: tRNA lysidine(34) synthetase TilS [Gammaproteobacteria bacterium]
MFRAAALLPQLQELPAGGRLLVAYSGGLDSTALLHALASLREETPMRLAAVHVNHGLQPQAGEWAAHCARACSRLQIPLQLIEVAVDTSMASLEAAAREARYAAFERIMQRGDVLLTAHHQDDQAETLLLNLMRGSGLHGLAGMPRTRRLGEGLLLRPLLHVSRAELEAFANEAGLSWIMDPTNAGIDFDRNFLRHRVLPLLEERWPVAVSKIARSAELAGESVALLDEEAAARIGPLLQAPGRIDLAGLMQQPPSWRVQLMRHWLRRAGAPPLPARQLDEFLRQLTTAADDRQPGVEWHGWTLRRHGELLYLGEALPEIDSGYCADWDGSEPLALPGNLGMLRLIDGAGHALQVRFRREGDEVRFNGHSRPLKTLMQELGMPPWLRERVPLVTSGGSIVAIADRAYADEAPVRLAWEGFPADFLP